MPAPQFKSLKKLKTARVKSGLQGASASRIAYWDDTTLIAGNVEADMELTPEIEKLLADGTLVRVSTLESLAPEDDAEV